MQPARFVVVGMIIIASFSACKKDEVANPGNNNPPDTTNYPNPVDTTNNPVDTTHPANPADTFTTYIILAGEHYAIGTSTSFPAFAKSSVTFKAILDSSCIYATVDPNNQADINKLYGFADNNSFHQTNSARFGWNWMNGEMHIHAYCYSSGLRAYKELGTVSLNTEFDCSIEVIPGKYIFTLNGKKDTMQRTSVDTIANGYKLFPYFGGDETAPHMIKVKIKELK